MRTRFLLAIALFLGCRSEADAEKHLIGQGFTDVSVSRQDGGGFQFTATKDGVPCKGSVAMSGLLAIGEQTVVSSACMDVPTPREIEVEPTYVPRGLGRPIAYEDDRPAHLRMQVTASEDDLASSAAVALLTAFSGNDREWIAAHSTAQLRRALPELGSNVNGPLLAMRGARLGAPRVLEQSASQEIVVFEVATEAPVEGIVELAVVFEGNAFAATELRGPGHASARTKYIEGGRSLGPLGSWVYTVRDGVLPDGVAAAGDDLKIAFVFDRTGPGDARMPVEYSVVHVAPGGKTRKIRLQGRDLGPDNEASELTIDLGGVAPGRHRLDVTMRRRAKGGRSDKATHVFRVEPTAAVVAAAGQ